MTSGYDAIRRRANADHLDIFGAFHPELDDKTPDGTGTILLLGPHEPGFWVMFQTSPEFIDHAADPIDRWSTRVVSALAMEIGAQPLFPFGGPPYQPFISWAVRSGRAWQSPAGMLIHDRAGLMVSYRGALALPDRLDLPSLPPLPFCDTCSGRPCLTACPVEALSAAEGYDLEACHGFLDTEAGQDCRALGCAARRVCPVSQSYGRLPEQSAFHMKSFHP